jgi:hypothetical protein
MQIRKWQKKNKHLVHGHVRRSGFLQFCEDVGNDLDLTEVIDSVPGRSEKDWHLTTMWKDLSAKQKRK